jgi:hypothetical protein
MGAVEWMVIFLGVYGATGLLFGIVFVIAGVHRVDIAAKDSGVGFRLIILPGVAALWPLLLRRWIREPS